MIPQVARDRPDAWLMARQMRDMVDLLELDDVLERVLTKGIVIEAQEVPMGAPKQGEGKSEWRSVSITGVIVLKATDE
jgi:hypothetical protein